MFIGVIERHGYGSRYADRKVAHTVLNVRYRVDSGYHDVRLDPTDSAPNKVPSDFDPIIFEISKIASRLEELVGGMVLSLHASKP